MNETLNWYGWTTPFSGYGIVSLEYMEALDKLTGGMVSVGWQRRKADNSHEWQNLTLAQRHLLAEKPFTKSRIGIIKTTPYLFKHNVSDIKIGYTMVENTKIGEDWVKRINQMAALFVPSKYLVDVAKESGVTVPIFPVKQGINPNRYPYMEREPKKKFIFGICGWLDGRKNWVNLVRAFVSEFSPEEPVELWLKNSNDAFGFQRAKDERVKYLDAIFSFDDMMTFYRNLDCFVFPSRAEGAGMPPREAMATGLPVILTNWSGLADISNSEYNYPIDPVAIDHPDPRGNEQPGFQARIDVQELMYWMRYVYEHADEAREKGKKASEWMHREWSWDSCAKEMLDILEKNFAYNK